MESDAQLVSSELPIGVDWVQIRRHTWPLNLHWAHTYSTHQITHTALTITCGRITWGHGEGKRPEEKQQNKRKAHSSTCRLRERERHYQRRNWVSVKTDGGEWSFKGVRWVWEGFLKEIQKEKGKGGGWEKKAWGKERSRRAVRNRSETALVDRRPFWTADLLFEIHS